MEFFPYASLLRQRAKIQFCLFEETFDDEQGKTVQLLEKVVWFFLKLLLLLMMAMKTRMDEKD